MIISVRCVASPSPGPDAAPPAAPSRFPTRRSTATTRTSSTIVRARTLRSRSVVCSSADRMTSTRSPGSTRPAWLVAGPTRIVTARAPGPSTAARNPRCPGPTTADRSTASPGAIGTRTAYPRSTSSGASSPARMCPLRTVSASISRAVRSSSPMRDPIGRGRAAASTRRVSGGPGGARRGFLLVRRRQCDRGLGTHRLALQIRQRDEERDRRGKNAEQNDQYDDSVALHRRDSLQVRRKIRGRFRRGIRAA